MNTLFIAGGAGFIGSSLIRILIAESDWTVVVINKLTYAGACAQMADVTDAGHTVIATLAVMVSSRLDIVKAMLLANRAGGLVVAKFRTSSLTYEQLHR